MTYLKEEKVAECLNKIGNRIFSVEFTTGKGEYRKYTGRINVTKGVKGNEIGQRVAEAFKVNKVVPMMTPTGEYKSFKMDHVLSLTCGEV